MAAILLLPLLLWTQPHTVRLAEHHWRQEIHIDRFGPTVETSWCHQLAPGAHEVILRSEMNAYRPVPDAEDCHLLSKTVNQGSVSTTRECQSRFWTEPAYEMRCDFQLDRWKPYRTVVAEGYSLEPDWPESGMIGAVPCSGCEREAARDGYYELILSAGGNTTFRCPLPLERWLETHTGSLWQLDVGMMDGRPRCDTLTPAT